MVEGKASDDPLSFESLLRGVITLVRAHPIPLLVPLTLLSALFAGVSRDTLRLDLGSSPLALAPLLAFMGLIALVLILGGSLVLGTLLLVGTRAAVIAVEGRTPDLSGAFHDVRPTLASGILAFLVFAVLAAVGFLLLIVPGVFIVGVLAPWFAVHLVERSSGIASFQRAWALSEGRRVELFLLALGGVGASLLAELFLGWWPFIGDLLVGVVNGLLLSAYVALGVVYYARRTAPIIPAGSPDDGTA